MTQDLQEAFEKLVQESRVDRDIIGLVLGGSRGKGFATKQSDYDVTLVVTQEAFAAKTAKLAELPSGFDVGVYTSSYLPITRFGTAHTDGTDIIGRIFERK